MSEVILKTTDLVREYQMPRPSIFSKQASLRVLHGVSIALAAGQSLGIVGESGSGKSTLARAVMGLERPQSGEVNIAGRDIYALNRADMREARKGFQAIFQDPYGSLDPRHTVRTIISEPIVSLERGIAAPERNRRIAEVLEAVGLPVASADKYPHEFSGGQRQRIAIARALITRPALIVADEPVSALDVSIQAQVLNLMMELQERLGLSYLFISHDLGVVRAITDRVAVMHLGRIVEEGPTGEVFDNPRHPYTQALVAAVPKPFSGRRKRMRSDAPPQTPVHTATTAAGCAYSAVCPLRQDLCLTQTPIAKPVTPTWSARCHFA
ncbi:Oligopeptide transport ATP-binding protein OppF [Ensifer sp. M14]|uniref:ABC transporter ATP-binding protein n=1 Tax=Sinorhizobium/Ensifer group TaxID=227292 RepID=UPI0009876A87|nr:MULTISPECIES: oligopeptide/dipeptide ABC transporter ATP-binding protein [Sinorhizobium/Ensifer group]OOG65692.1 peptide ABC transporter ATP-binding protein [Sinorhizobium sp. A49]RDL47581.1 Oligopeptide transport ATP-binding protein OppF [Ensifer sp. M14]